MTEVMAEALAEVRVTHARLQLAELDALRSLRRASSLGVSQTRLAGVLKVSQPAVSGMLAKQVEVAALYPEGRHGSSPYEVAERYAAGQITRDQLVAELGSWDYVPQDRARGLDDDVLVYRQGSFDEVERAADDGLIDDEAYDAIIEASEGARSGS